MWQQEGEWYVIVERTRKPFAEFKVDATRGLMTGIPALFTTHQWGNDRTCHVDSLGSEGIISYDQRTGTATCKVRIRSFPATFFKTKILSDVAAIFIDVCGNPALGNKDLFIVHGHNETAREELKTILLELQMNPIVLSQQDDLGLTIIEKFEYYARNCSFAFVLMTPDDKTEIANVSEQRWRARQNVIMELGWFMAHLGRERVMVLHNGELDIPSDILGVVTLEFKSHVREQIERIRQRLSGLKLI